MTQSSLTPGPGARRRHPVTLAALASAGGFALALALGGPALAHNAIVSATPDEGEVLTSVPEAFEIVTNETLLDVSGDGAGFGILVSDPEGLYYGDGCLTVEGSAMSMPATLGNPGEYTLTYQYISADGHTLSGDYGFSYAPEGEQPFSVGSAEPPVCGETVTEPSPEPESTPSPEASAPAETAEPSPEVSTPAEDDAVATDDATPIGLIAAWVIGGALIVGAAIAAIVMTQRRRSAP